MRRLARLIYIFFTAWRFGLLSLLRDNLKPGFRRGLLSIFCWASPGAHLPRGERIRLTLEALGPIFVKFGQVLSTRRDLLPEDISDELAKLQDQVPPFSKFPPYGGKAKCERWWRALGFEIGDGQDER